jgi:hypothetical protein
MGNMPAQQIWTTILAQYGLYTSNIFSRKPQMTKSTHTKAFVRETLRVLLYFHVLFWIHIGGFLTLRPLSVMLNTVSHRKVILGELLISTDRQAHIFSVCWSIFAILCIGFTHLQSSLRWAIGLFLYQSLDIIDGYIFYPQISSQYDKETSGKWLVPLGEVLIMLGLFFLWSPFPAATLNSTVSNYVTPIYAFVFLINYDSSN